jgi:hypothetical protein
VTFRNTHQQPEGATVLGAFMLAAALSAPFWLLVILVVRAVVR